MKTIKELLEELPEPYRSKALANYDEDFYETSVYNEPKDLEQALMAAFHWSKSSEGNSYWMEAVDKIKKVS